MSFFQVSRDHTIDFYQNIESIINWIVKFRLLFLFVTFQRLISLYLYSLNQLFSKKGKEII